MTSWKVWERQVARDLGGHRTGPRGFNLPDVSGVEGIAAECKYMKRLALRDDHMRQARDNAGGEPWALFLREAKTGRRVVVLDYQHFLNLYRGST